MPESEDYRRYLEAQFSGVMASINTLRSDVRDGAAGIHSRLDKVNGRLDKHDDAIRTLQMSQAREDGVHSIDGRMTPGKEARAAGNFTQDTGTWTVASGDVTTNAYVVIGKTMIWNLSVATSTVATKPVELRCTIPAGATAQTSAYVTGLAIINGTAEFIRVDAQTGVTYVRAQRLTPGAWSASTDNTWLLFQSALEIA